MNHLVRLWKWYWHKADRIGDFMDEAVDAQKNVWMKLVVLLAQMTICVCLILLIGRSIIWLVL